MFGLQLDHRLRVGLFSAQRYGLILLIPVALLIFARSRRCAWQNGRPPLI
jgi:hypothetical protein